MDCILGVDSGGTKTIAWVTSISGRLLAEGISGSGSYISVGAGQCNKKFKHFYF